MESNFKAKVILFKRIWTHSTFFGYIKINAREVKIIATRCLIRIRQKAILAKSYSTNHDN